SHTGKDILAVQRYPFRASSWIAGAIGTIALLLTLTGVYGVLAYLVAQRTREIGVRMALGADARDIVFLVVRESGRFAAVGLATGLLLSLAASSLLGNALYLVHAFDPAGYIIGTGVVVIACLAAAWLPSRRAARVDPLVALRAE